MEGLISTFHIDYKIIIAQIINFAIVFVVLYIYALKPLGRLMEKRRKEIEKGLHDAQKSETVLIDAQQKAEAEIKNAKQKANEILREAKQKGDALIEDARKRAEQELLSVKEKAKKEIEEERAEAEQRVYQKLAGLVSLGLEKILGEEIDERKHQEIEQKLFQSLTDSN